MNKALFAALAVVFSLAVTGCELITGNDSPAPVTPSVHGTVKLLSSNSEPFPANAQLTVLVTPVLLLATDSYQARAAAAGGRQTVAVTAYGTYSYAVTGVADGSAEPAPVEIDYTGPAT